jgi:putative membrane protein insertion efficiency factor
MSLPVKIAQGLIRAYQLTLSAFIGRSCRHLPTCSEYATDALERHGGWRGGILAISRITRCNPLGSHGYDPVPEKLENHGFLFWKYGRWSGKHLDVESDSDSSS